MAAETNTDRLTREIMEQENHEWIEALEYVMQSQGRDRARDLLRTLLQHASKRGVPANFPGSTPYVNTIPHTDEPPYPGSREIERRIKSLVRWNAMAMVVRANRERDGIGGHISTFASAASLYEVAQNHFLLGPDADGGGDIVYFQGHASPGMYARAFLEGRLTKKNLENFRAELSPDGGLSSYPHPWLMPNFWQFPTVSMGLGPIMSIYQARFNHYLSDRGIKDTANQRIWAFLGDGEMDEPESMGALTLASREQLDNLTWVVNCNLQRLDGPVRGNGRVVQELEAAFRGAGWKVYKVVLGSNWDPLLDADKQGLIVKRLGEIVDGDAQRYFISDGSFVREHFFGKYPELAKLVENWSDEQIRNLRRGGHDPHKIFAAFKAATETKGRPSVVLAQTIKGYGMGEAGEGKNITHQQKKLNLEELKHFRSRFGIPISDNEIQDAPFYKPEDDSIEIKYLKERRKDLGGSLPQRREEAKPLTIPGDDVFGEYKEGSGDRTLATTMVYVAILGKLLRNKKIGKHIVPIVPDEARTFGMEALFRQVGIYAHTGQLYEPVDRESLLYYKEAKDGAILEEGITEAGSMSSFIAAGTSYATHGVPMVPFFSYYSMFGFQRIGDLAWAAGDVRAKGFLMGGTAGRTTLAGEGLQHTDGNSHVLALPIPNLKAYDPAYAYEMAIIIRDGLKRMYEDQETLFYYITMMNEQYQMPPMPAGDDIEEGILRGIYKFKASDSQARKKKAHLLGSGTILNEAREAARILEEDFDIPADVWSVTSYKELYMDCTDSDRANMRNPNGQARKNFLEQQLEGEGGVFVAATDYMKVLPAMIAKWMPEHYAFLGTDGYGRSDHRAEMRDFFEVDARHIAFAALTELSAAGQVSNAVVKDAMKTLKIDGDKPNPVTL
ncbi:pyruvate dehydrogenase (acetyl-transferring), homodimeric type [bacterium]|nr:pyruvate dehydrogenase (acetyl-transferring), homodimeric type [bacterium]